jgi:hypothetical protein
MQAAYRRQEQQSSRSKTIQPANAAKLQEPQLLTLKMSQLANAAQ